VAQAEGRVADVLEVNYSRFVGWVLLIVYLPLIFLAAYAVTHPAELRAELAHTDKALVWLLFSWMPAWLTFLLSVWLLGVCLVQFLVPLGFMCAKEANFRFDPTGITLSTWKKGPTYFSWRDLHLIRFTNRGVALKLQIRTKTEIGIGFENVLRKVFFAPVIPDVNGPALQERMGEVFQHMKEHAPEDILEIKDND